MNRDKLMKLLGDISGQMDVFLVDSNLLTAVKDFRDIQGKFDELINELEDEDDSSPQMNEND